eukprot:105456-Chlamydomonas_euryale.AAC.1
MPDDDVMQKEESEIDVQGILRTAMGNSTCWRIVLAHVRECGEGVPCTLQTAPPPQGGVLRHPRPATRGGGQRGYGEGCSHHSRWAPGKGHDPSLTFPAQRDACSQCQSPRAHLSSCIPLIRRLAIQCRPLLPRPGPLRERAAGLCLRRSRSLVRRA